MLGIALAVIVVCGTVSSAQEPAPPQDSSAVTPSATGFLPRSITIGDVAHRYVVYVPAGYTRERDWPLLVFLNGMGECGTDGQRQVEVGLGPAIRAEPERWPFVVVFPQKPDKGSQWSEHEALVMGTLAATEKEFRIDPRRRLLTGLSQGGAGTWALGSKHAKVWAAIAPVCGYKTPAFDASALNAIPIWAFHGLDDKVVPVGQSKEMCEAVEQAGGSPLLTLYPGVGHNSWDRAYRESGLAEWICAVADEPLGARLLAMPETLTAVTITIHQRPAASASSTPRTTRLAVAGTTWEWALPPGIEGALRGGGGTTAASWQDSKDASRLVHSVLRSLQRAGAFDARSPAVVDDRVAGARLDVLLRGPAGEWSFSRHVAADAPQHGPFAAAMQRVTDAIAIAR